MNGSRRGGEQPSQRHLPEVHAAEKKNRHRPRARGQPHRFFFTRVPRAARSASTEKSAAAAARTFLSLTLSLSPFSTPPRARSYFLFPAASFIFRARSIEPNPHAAQPFPAALFSARPPFFLSSAELRIRKADRREIPNPFAVPGPLELKNRWRRTVKLFSIKSIAETAVLIFFFWGGGGNFVRFGR